MTYIKTIVSFFLAFALFLVSLGTTTEPITETTTQPKTDWLTIPSVNISVQLEYAYDGNTQEICDKQNCACAYKYSNGYGIADHNYQGFDKLYGVKVGAKATATIKGETHNYTCNRVISNGYNKKQYLTDQNGNKVELTSKQIQIYTCMQQNAPQRIFITIWTVT